MRRLAISLLVVCQAYAGEYAVLRSGFRLHAEQHEVTGDVTRLLTKTGALEMPSSNIVGFEVEEYVAPKPEPSIPALPTVASIVSPPLTPLQLLGLAATKNGLRPEFVHSVAAVESAYRTNAISPKGAIGLMQLMPGTAKDLGVNPHNPAENAEAGARYLKQLLVEYQGATDPVRLALAAYNAGPGAVDKHGAIPPYRETQAYVERVLRKYVAELNRTN